MVELCAKNSYTDWPGADIGRITEVITLSDVRLTRLEMDVLRCLAKGMNKRGAMHELGKSSWKVWQAMRSIQSKLSAPSVARVVDKAREQGLIS